MTGQRLDARCAFAAFALTICAPFFARSLVGTAMPLALAVCALTVTRPNLTLLRSAMVALSVTCVFVIAIQGIAEPHATVTLVAHHTTRSGLLRGALRAADIATLACAALALTSAIPAPELGRGLAFWLAPLRLIRIPVAELALMLALAFAMVPRLAADLDDLRLAQAARGIDRNRQPIGVRIRLARALVAPLTVGAFRQSRVSAETMYARGYGIVRHPTRYHADDVHITDLALVAIAIATLGVAIAI